MMRITILQHTLLTAIISLCAAGSFGQSATSLEKKKELLERVLEEKHFHLPGDVAGKSGSKTTATGFDQRVTASSTGVSESEISIEYNPNDSSKIVLSFMKNVSGGLTFPIYYSSDAGATWTLSNFNATNILQADYPGQFPAGGGDPAFAWDKSGRLYFAWIYLSVPATLDTAFFTLNWAYSDDNGHTWSVKPKHFIGSGAIDPSSNTILDYRDGITDREWLAVDNSGGIHQGNLYCSFVCFPGNGGPNFEGTKTLIPGIDTFGVKVPAYTGSTQFGNVVVDHNGILHMSFAELDNIQVRHVSSSDGGVSFGTSHLVSAATELFPGGPTFTVHNRENAAINIASGGSAGGPLSLHIVWSDFTAGTVKSFYSHSIDGGISWSTPDTLDKRFHGLNTLMPTVAVFGNNVTVSVTATDSSDSASYFILNSVDGGNTFAVPLQVSSVPTDYVALNAPDPSSTLFFGDYTRSVRAACNVYTTWADGRSGEPKVYFARKNYCALGVNEITAVNDGVQLVSVFPNPASANITLQIKAGAAQPATVELTDLAGRKLMTTQISLHAGQQQVNLPLTNVASGNYLLSLYSNNGLNATRIIAVK